MKVFRHTILAGAILLGTLKPAQAQQFTLNESTTEIKGPQHVLLNCSNGDYLTITYPFADDNDPVIVARFDHSLTQKYSTPIVDLKKIHYRSNLYLDRRLSLFANDKDGNVSRYDIDEKTGALTGSPAPLFTFAAKEDDTKFFTGNAPGRNFHYFVTKQRIKKEKGAILQGALLDQQYGKLADFSFTTPEDNGDFNHLDLVQGDDGTLYMIYSVNVKTTKDEYTPHTFKVVMVDTRGATHAYPMNGIPKGDLGDLCWTIDGTRLSFTGFLAPEKKKGFTTVVTGSLDFQKKKGGIHQTQLGTLMAKVPDYLQRYKNDGISTAARLIHSRKLSDGSHIIVLEDNGSLDYQSHYAPMSTSNPGYASAPVALRTGMQASYSITYYDRGNLFVLKTDINNIPQWMNIITKYQREADMAIAIGTACTVDSKDNIHLFFTDNKKDKDPDSKKPKEVDGLKYKKNKLACVTIDPAGTMTKTFIDLEQPKYRPILEKSEGGVTNELQFMTIRKKTAFSINHMLNHADYRLATITITPGATPALAGN
jgi:hypothetical protein